MSTLCQRSVFLKESKSGKYGVLLKLGAKIQAAEVIPAPLFAKFLTTCREQSTSDLHMHDSASRICQQSRDKTP